MSIADDSAIEGSVLGFAVSLDAPAATDVVVTATTADGTATGADFGGTSADVTIPEGERERVFAVATGQDLLDEPAETFTVTLSDPQGATIGDRAATGTIEDDDGPPPSVRIEAPAAVAEGGALRFPIRLDRAPGATIELRVTTADGTAKAPGDYLPRIASQVRISRRATETFFVVPTRTDGLAESDEAVRAEITSATGATIAAAAATGTIHDAGGALRLQPGRVLGGRLVSGRVTVTPPGSPRSIDLGAEAGLPVGTRVNARRGEIELSTGTRRARFSGGVFTIRQGRYVTLVLGGRVSCEDGVVRRLWADGAGPFRTKGRYAVAGARNGRWLTEDRCRATRVRVARGRATVRDTVRATTRTVRAGRTVTIRRRRAAR